MSFDWKKLAQLILLISATLVASDAFATTFYIAANGSDGNSGTSKSSPWLHAPGMTGVSGVPASYSPQPGDSFIFRGGDQWHNTGSPSGLDWGWSWSGTSGNVIYIGGGDQTWSNGNCTNSGLVDTNGTQVLLPAYGESTVGTSTTPFVAASVWNGTASAWIGGTITINSANYTIASVQSPYQLMLTTSAGTQNAVPYSNSLWCRPVLNGDGADTSNHAYIQFDSVTYATLDQWEIKGLYASASNLQQSTPTSPLNWAATAQSSPRTASNLFIHGWTHAAYNASTPNSGGWYLWWGGSTGGAYGTGQVYTYIDIDGSDSTNSTFWNGATGTTQSCASGNVPSGGPVSFYYPDGVCTSGGGFGFDAYELSYSRIKYVSNGVVTNNTHLFHDNVLERLYQSWNTAGDGNHDNCFEFNGEYSAANLVYNNVVRYSSPAQCDDINPPPGFTDLVFNNAFYYLNQGPMGMGSGSPAGGSALFYNNTWGLVATDGATPSTGCIGYTFGSGFSSVSFVNNLYVTTSGSSPVCPGSSDTSSITMTASQAIARGYAPSTSTYSYQPSSSTCNGLSPCGIGTGTNGTTACGALSQSCINDTTAGATKVAVLRPNSAWNMGAYQTVGAAGSGSTTTPQPPTALSATVQ